MRIAELLALLGRSWVLLFIYPGGLGILLALVWELRTVEPQNRRTAEPRTKNRRTNPPQDNTQLPITNYQAQISATPTPISTFQRFNALRFALSASALVALPWLALALLPLPFAVNTGRSLDVVMVLMLLEWPRLLVAVREARTGQIQRLATLLNSYPPLIVAILLLATPTGSFEIGQLMQLPADATPLLATIAHWLGAACLLLALPALLEIGPFACPLPTEVFTRIGLRLRSIAITTLAILPFAALIPEPMPWLLPIPIAGILLLLWGIQRTGAGHASRLWAQALWWLSIVGVGVVAVVTVVQF